MSTKIAMSAEYPTSVREWSKYIEKLSGRRLLDEARAANQVQFVRTLEEEGFKPTEINEIFHLFAQQFISTGQAAPGRFQGHYLNYRDLIDEIEDGA